MMRLCGTLPAPWDAAVLAEKWPHLFALIDAQQGTVAVRDVEGVLKLRTQTDSVDVDFDGEGLSLRAFGSSCELMAA